MSGYMVSQDFNGQRNFWMVNIADQELAIKEVTRRRGVEGVQALAPLSCATFEHFGVPIGEMRHFTATDLNGNAVREMAF